MVLPVSLMVAGHGQFVLSMRCVYFSVSQIILCRRIRMFMKLYKSFLITVPFYNLFLIFFLNT